jgi:hypothetical protein
MFYDDYDFVGIKGELLCQRQPCCRGRVCSRLSFKVKATVCNSVVIILYYSHLAVRVDWLTVCGLTNVNKAHLVVRVIFEYLLLGSAIGTRVLRSAGPAAGIS